MWESEGFFVGDGSSSFIKILDDLGHIAPFL